MAIRNWLQVLAAWVVLCSCPAVAGAPRLASEYQVKAVFLYNFTKFFSWPTNAVTSTNSPFIIGVVGEDPFGPVLDDALHDQSVQNRPIVVKRFRSDQASLDCDMLFIARSEQSRLKEIVERVQRQAILTVADTDQATEKGVMVNLLLVQDSVKMEINQSSVESAGLAVSSKLLSLARIVNPIEQNPPAKP